MAASTASSSAASEASPPSPPPSPPAGSSRLPIATTRHRLQLLLESTVYLGPTTARVRRGLARSLLIQRNLEIQAQQLIIDEEYDALLEAAEQGGAEAGGAAQVGGRLAALDAESDVLAEESDEVETLLYEKFHVRGGGRVLLMEEMQEAASIGEQLGRGTKGRMTGSGQRQPAPAPSRHRRLQDEEGKEESDEVKEVKEVKEQPDANDFTAQAEEKTGGVVSDDGSGVSDVTVAESEDGGGKRQRGPGRGRGRGRGRGGRKRLSRSDAAVLQRLDAQSEENERRRAERAEANADSLLGKLYSFFDTHVDVSREERKAELTEEEREERRRLMAERRKAAVRSFPYILGTISFPLFPVSESKASNDAEQQQEEQEAQSVRLDFSTEPPLPGEDGCVVRRKKRAVAADEDGENAEEEETIGFLPFPFHWTPLPTASTAAPTLYLSAASPFPLPLHPLLALHLLLEANVASVEATVSFSSPQQEEDGADDEQPPQPRRVVDVTVFLHDKFLHRSRLRSNLLRLAMLSLFRLFPTPQEADEADEQQEEEAEQAEAAEAARMEMMEGKYAEEAEAEPAKDDNTDGMEEEKQSDMSAPVSKDVFSAISEHRRAQSSLLAPSLSQSFSSSSSSPPAPFMFESSPPVPSSGTESIVLPQPKKEKRRIVPSLVTEEEGKEELQSSAWEQQQQQQEKMVTEEQSDRMDWQPQTEDGEEDEEGGGNAEDDDDDEEEKEEEEEEDEEDEEDEDEDDFGLSVVEATQLQRAFVDLQLTSSAPVAAAATAQLETAAPAEAAYAPTAEEEKEEKEQEEEGLRIEEAYTLDPAVLADDAASVSTTSSSSAAGGQSSHAEDGASALHSFAWQKRDLDTLYNSLRPSSSWPCTATPPLLRTPLLPFQQQALTWMMQREQRAAFTSFPHPLWEYVSVHGQPAFYNRVTGEVQLREPQRVQDVSGGILAEMMGLGKTMEMIALVLQQPYVINVNAVAPLLPRSEPEDEAKAEKKEQPVAMKLEEKKQHEEKDDEQDESVMAVQEAKEQQPVDAAQKEEQKEQLTDLPMAVAELPVDTSSLLPRALFASSMPSSPPAAAVQASPSAVPTSPPAGAGQPPQLVARTTSDVSAASVASASSLPAAAGGPAPAPGSPPPITPPRLALLASRVSASSPRRRSPYPVVVNEASRKPEIKGTLVITPHSIVYQWKSEIAKHAPSLKVLVYTADTKIDLFPTATPHSIPTSDSPLSPSSFSSPSPVPASPPSVPAPTALLSLSEYDIVLTNYSVLAAQVNYSQQPSYAFRQEKRYAVPMSPLLEVHWHRLVLDEAQRVQNAISNSAKMAQRVPATHRWAVTGTPIGLHGLNDVYGLVLFLGLQPYCLHSVWLKTMTVQSEEGMARLVQLLRCIMWRHSKQHVRQQIALPPLYVHSHYLNFNEVEREAYRRFEWDVRGRTYFQAVKGQLEGGEDMVQRLDALRQMCDHPQVLASGMWVGKERKFDSMDEIGRRIVQRARDEAAEKEREVCRLLNSLGLLLKRHGREEEAERYLKESWTVYDRGNQEAKRDDAEMEKLRQRGEKAAEGGREIKSSEGQEEGGDFDSEENIVTANTQLRQWKFIEVVASFHLKELYERRLRRLSAAAAASPPSLSLSSASSQQAELLSLQSNISTLATKLDAALDELLDLVLHHHRQVQDFIGSMLLTILPMWTTRPADDVRSVLQQWNSRQDMQSFFSSPVMKEVRALHRKYQRQNVLVEKYCLMFEKEQQIAPLEELIRSRADAASLCQARQFLHQEMLHQYYPADTQQAVDRVLYRDLKALQKHRRDVHKSLLDMLETDEEKAELQRIDWQDVELQDQYERRWMLEREQQNAMLTLLDLRKGVNNERTLRDIVVKARAFLLKSAAKPPENFGIDGITLGAVQGDDGSGGGKAGKEDKKDADEEADELLSLSALAAAVSRLQTQLAALRTAAQQKQRHVKYLDNRLSHLQESPASGSAAAAGETCPICNAEVVQPVITKCGHVYCLNCFQSWMTKGRKGRKTGEEDGVIEVETRLAGWERGSCPTCRQELTRTDVDAMPQEQLKRPQRQQDDTSEARQHRRKTLGFTVTTCSSFSSSWTAPHGAEKVEMPPLEELSRLQFPGQGESGTKVDCIIRHLLHLLQRHEKVKSLVYSQFPRMLQLFSAALTRAGIPHLQLEGSNPRKAAATIHQFQTSSAQILLLSLRRDSSGLTLVSASHVFLLEPSLERSVELQAINRIHRIGQQQVCHVWRFVMRRSVEAKIDRQVHGGQGDHSGAAAGRKRKMEQPAAAAAARGGGKEEKKEQQDDGDDADYGWKRRQRPDGGKEEKMSGPDDEEDGEDEDDRLMRAEEEREDAVLILDDDDARDGEVGLSQHRKELLNRGELLTYLDLNA